MCENPCDGFFGICDILEQTVSKRVSNPLAAISALLLCGFWAIFSSCNADAPTSLLEGVEVVETIPATEVGDEPQPIGVDGPSIGGVLAAPLYWCQIPDPAIDVAIEGISIASAPLVTEIHAGLTRIVDDPNAPVQLELADSYEVKNQGLEYTFVLRQSLKFSDGSLLTAHDFKWSWERAIGKSVTASRARDVFGLVEGADANVRGESTDLVGVSVVDDRTLKVHLTQPRADFLALLADPVASVLNRENVRLWGMQWENEDPFTMDGRFTEDNMPVGAGPFKLIDYWIASEPGHCAIARNQHYWGRKTYLDGVLFRPDAMNRESDSDDSLTVSTDPQAFAQRETDYESVGFTTTQSDPEAEIEVEGARVLKTNYAPTISFLVFNTAAPPFDDVHFRRAAAASADVESLAWQGRETPRLITEDLTTFELENIYTGYDMEKAMSELAASKYAGSDEVWEANYLVPSFSLLYEVEKIFDAWSELSNLNVVTDLDGLNILDEFDGRMNDEYHVRIFHVSPSYPDPATVLRAITSPFGEINKAPEFVALDEMMAIAAVEPDAVKRHELYLEIERYLADQALVIPIEVFASGESYRVHPWVHDLNAPKYPGTMFHDVWLDKSAPHRELPNP